MTTTPWFYEDLNHSQTLECKLDQGSAYIAGV
jgi:hypothetical protein